MRRKGDGGARHDRLSQPTGDEMTNAKQGRRYIQQYCHLTRSVKLEAYSVEETKMAKELLTTL
jgi:hypothetical protein